jgi:hypothetical protein
VRQGKTVYCTRSLEQKLRSHLNLDVDDGGVQANSETAQVAPRRRSRRREETRNKRSVQVDVDVGREDSVTRIVIDANRGE